MQSSTYTARAAAAFRRRLEEFVVSLGDPELPDAIYHYTSHVGLLGILKTRSIWGTHIAYLNDKTEMILPATLVRSEIERRRGLGQMDVALASMLLDDVSVAPSEYIFVASFSAARDDLSQWRGYCPPDGGYAIGLSVSTALEISGRALVTLLPVKYEHDEHLFLIEQLLATAKSFDRDLKAIDDLPPSEFSSHLAVGYRRFLGIISPMIKHHAFHQEREWRLVSIAVDPPREKMSFRAGRGVLIPYIEVTLQDENALLHLNEVIVGPNANTEYAKASVRLALDKFMITYGDVTSSGIPLRSGL